jgi:NADH-quinone oxidoreductase subunit C
MADEPAPKPAAAPAARPAPKPAEHKVEAPAGPPDPPPPDGQALPVTVTAVTEALPDAVIQVSYWVGDWTIVTTPERLVEVCGFLRDDPRTELDFCSDVTVSDWPARERRFDVIYCLYSTRLCLRLRVKVRAGEGEPVPSVTGVWPAANWLEREVYDMFGVEIVNHPDRRRILMPDQWQGHPQRKDYPLEGPGELLLEDPIEWLRLRNQTAATDIE